MRCKARDLLKIQYVVRMSLFVYISSAVFMEFFLGLRNSTIGL